MSYDTLGMIRRGWQDGAATVAPHVPGLADLLERRLSEATRLGRLDEVSLLSIVDAATQLAADFGAVDVAPALSKRLRRHVYEYLLSLDAIGDTVAAAPAGQAPAPEGLEMLIGADEVATMGGPELPEAEVMIPGVERWLPRLPAPVTSRRGGDAVSGSGDTRSQPGADTLSGSGGGAVPSRRSGDAASRAGAAVSRRGGSVCRRARGGGDEGG